MAYPRPTRRCAGLDPALNVLRKELQASDINNALAEANQFVAVVLYDPNNTGQTTTQTDLKTILKNAAAGRRKPNWTSHACTPRAMA